MEEEGRLFDPDAWEERATITLNGEEVYYRATTLNADPDEMRPEDSLHEEYLKWPDGSAFRMEFYLSPAWWKGESEGKASLFYGAAHDLIRDGFGPEDGLKVLKAPFYFAISEEEGIRLDIQDAEQAATPQTVLRVLADLIEMGKLD
jgi:hypothetical protein